VFRNAIKERVLHERKNQRHSGQTHMDFASEDNAFENAKFEEEAVNYGSIKAISIGIHHY
jgi:hypothetical protein